MKEKDDSSSDEELNLKSSENINTINNINPISIQISDNENNIFLKNKEIELQQVDGKEDAIIRDNSEEAKKKEEKEKIKEIHNSYLYNIKDYIFFFAIMISTSINFNYLYLLFVLIGIIYLFLIRSNNDSSKFFRLILEIVTLIYSFSLTIFKIVCLILIKKNNAFINDHSKLFLDLGIYYLRDKDSIFYFLMSFLGEAIMIFFSIYSFLISLFCRHFSPINDISTMENSFWTNRNLIMLNYFFILSFSVFNVSFLTLFYMCFIQFIFFLDSLTNKRNKIQGCLKFYCYMILLLIIAQITAINILNIPRFQEKVLHGEVIIEKDNDKEKIIKDYSIWTKIGINYAYYEDLLLVLKEWLGYLAAICSLLSLTFSIKTIKVNENCQRHKNITMNFRTAKTILKKSEENEKKDKIKDNPDIEKKNGGGGKVKKILKDIIDFIEKLFRDILNFITSPTFIIQFSRVMSIAWIYFYRNFYSIGIFITLFFSFLFINAKSNKFLTIFLLTPMIFISLCCFHFSNINGFFEDEKIQDKNQDKEEDIEQQRKRIKYLHFGLGKYEYNFLEYYACNLFYIFTMFLIQSFYNTPIEDDKNNKKEEENIKAEKYEDIKLVNEELKNSLFDINDSGQTTEVKNYSKIDEENNINNILIESQNDIKKEEKEKETKEKKETKAIKIKDLSFINIILKAIFSNIDKITLIVMYFVAVRSINIVHFILVIIFLIQILLPNKIQNCFEIILCIMQFLFLFEVITDLLKVYYYYEFKNNKNFMNLMLIYTEKLSDNNTEIFIYGVVYCFYFQYQIFNFPFLKRIIENDKITLGNYVEYKFKRFERIKHILFVLGNIILELYIWILIGLFIFVSCFYEINFIFAIKLAWFLLLSYSFLKKIQNPDKGVEYSSFWQGLFLFFCCINTLSVYLYQFLSDDYIKYYENITESKNFFLKNLPNIGFTMYERDDLYYHFLPHFGVILISVLFIWEIRSQLDKLSKEKKSKSKKKKVEEIEDEIDLKLKQPNLSSEERELLKARKFEKNIVVLKNLSIRYFIINVMRIITKFYWLLLFLTIGIIFCFYDLSYSMTIYMIIFFIIFISMFYIIINKLTDYISRPSYFISKVIRYSLVEVPRHIEQNKNFRSIGFRLLLSYSFIFFILLYLYGVFGLFQNGCNRDFFKGCEERNEPFIKNNSDLEKYIKAYSYLFGIYVDIQNEGLMSVAWIHMLLSVLIGFEVYAQKLENKFTDDSEEIKALMQKLTNENSTLFHYTLMSDTNILIKVGLKAAGINNLNFDERLKQSINKMIASSRNNSVATQRTKSIQQQQEEKEIYSVNADENLPQNAFLKQSERVQSFKNIFSKANDNQQTLSNSNNGTKLIFFVKKFFEEMIIFLLICIALTKLNILSFIYLIYSAYLTTTKKTMMKFYVLYCCLLALIFFQSIIYISNISEKTCPRPNTSLLEILQEKLSIPWYKNKLDIRDKYAFFFGFGVNQIQTALILLEFVQVIVIYIYLDFFSYSIYQDVPNKGERRIKGDKFNFGVIKLHPTTIKPLVKNMDKALFIQYRDCLRNFELDIGDNLQVFHDKLNINNRVDNENKDSEDRNDANLTDNEELNKLLVFKMDYYKRRERNRREGTDNIPESKFYESFQEVLYLYLHCFILLFIIIVALMITGMLSIFYIVICFYYLINADKIYLGKVYGYPIAIKKLLKISVIIDIAIQTIYQIPYLSPDKDSVFQKIFDVLGLIKLVDYEANEGKDIKLISSGIIEVIGKPLIYFFLSLQVIIYKSKDFKKYYLTFLLKQKFEFNKNSLINAFRFNNERIEAFKKSMNLRLKSEKAMEELKGILEDWNKKLKIEGGNLFGDVEDEVPEENEDKQKEEKEKKEEEKKEEEKEVKKEEEENKKEGTKKNKVSPDEIKEKLTKILLNGYITKFYIWFNRHAIYYKSMENTIQKDYEKNCILGNLHAKCYLENELEKQLNILDLSDFNEAEFDFLKDLALKYKKGKLEKKLEDFKKLKEEEIKIKKAQIMQPAQGMIENNIQNINTASNINLINNQEPLEQNILEEQIPVNINLSEDVQVNVNAFKFRQFKYILETKLFTTYLTTSYQLKSILWNLESFLSNNFDYFCYFIMIIDHMINSSFLTMLYPLSIFCYALLENPRPKKIYWQICIFYTLFILSAKFFFQLKLFNNIFDEISYQKFLDKLYNYKVGITYFEKGFGVDFFKYIAFDSIVLIILSLNRNILISNGLWEKREEQIENIFTANERVETNKDRQIETQRDRYKLAKEFIFLKPEKKEKKGEENKNINIMRNEEEEKLIIKNEIKIENDAHDKKLKLKFNTGKFTSKYDEGNKGFIEKLFPKVRNEKPGDDFYPYYASALALIIIYILFFFTKMDQDKTYGPVDLDTTQFSGNMVLFLLLHVIILVYDRAIYISQNKNHLKYRYFIYKKNEKGKGEILSKEEFKSLKEEINKEIEKKKKKDKKQDENNNKVEAQNNKKDKRFYIPPSMFEKLNTDNYNLFYVQTELFNKPLLHKYILHILSTIVCHIFVFIYFPMKGNYNLLNTIYCIKGEECNDFTNNGYTIVFYLLYLIYLYLSSTQIRLGYFDIKRKSLFKNNTTLTNTISKVFNAIPFLPNIRNTVDWTFTSTCLDLFKWNKFESIYDTIFETYCDAEGSDDEKIGQKVTKKRKIIMGGILSFALIFVLVIPLVLFSSLNPTNKLNNLTSAKLNVDLRFKDENGVTLNYNLFENARAKTISNMFKNGNDVWKKYDYDDSVQTRNFKGEQIQIIKFSNTSDRNWDLAEPHIKDLIELLNITQDNGIATIELNILTEFERPLPAETQTVSHSFSVSVFDSSLKEDELWDGINKTLQLKNALENCEETKIKFGEAYSPPLRVTAGEEITEIEDEKYILKKGVQLGFQGCKVENETIGDKVEVVNSYSKSYFTFETNDTNGIWDGMEFHIFNDKISETTSGYSVLTFYLTFVLVAGSYVQEFLSSEPEKIMFTELPHPEKIVNLCEGIKISRYSYDFKKEEYLFTILIELMRSPDYLKLLTQSSIDHFKKREKKTFKNSDEEEEEEDEEEEEEEFDDEENNEKKKEKKKKEKKKKDKKKKDKKKKKEKDKNVEESEKDNK